MGKSEIRCTTCGIWSDANLDRCPTCSTPYLSLEEVPVVLPTKSNALDRFFDGWGQHSNPLIRGSYVFFKGIWMVYMAIVAFFLWLIAAMPG